MRAVAEHREPSLGGLAIDHVEALGIARPVDGGGAQYRRIEPPLRKVEHDGLGQIFGLLIVIRRLYRRSLGGRRIFDVAVHPAGAAIDQFAHFGGERLLQHDARSLDVDLVVVAAGNVEFAERGRQMLHDFDALHAAAHDGAIGHGADDDLGAPAAQLVRLVAFLVVEPDHLMAVVEQSLDERLAGEPRCTGNQNFHSCPFQKCRSR